MKHGRDTVAWLDDVESVTYRLHQLMVVSGLLGGSGYVLLIISVVCSLLVAVSSLSPWLPVILILVVGCLVGFRRYYCSRELTDLHNRMATLIREKDERLTIVGFVSFNGLPGYFLVIARGKGSFLAWQWGTETELKQSLGAKLDGRLLHTGLQMAVVSHVKVAQPALEQFGQSLAAALGEKYIALPPEVYRNHSQTGVEVKPRRE